MRGQFRAELLKDAPLHYAPENELGVVFLFSKVCPKLQVRIDRIQAGFPDCIAYQRVGGREKRVRIEFEFKSRNFLLHKHSARQCDWIVCWEHNWPGIPKTLQVLELRRFFGHGMKVWLMVAPPSAGAHRRHKWDVKNRMLGGDLVIMYNWWPACSIEHIFQVVNDGLDDVSEGKYACRLFKVCDLARPIHLRSMERNRFLADSKLFVGKSNRNITEHWWALYDMIIRRNPDAEKPLRAFTPEKC